MGLLLAMFCGLPQPQDARIEEFLREYGNATEDGLVMEQGAVEALREIARDDSVGREDRLRAIGLLLETGAIEESEAEKLVGELDKKPDQPEESKRPPERPRETPRPKEVPDTPLRRGSGLGDEPTVRVVERVARTSPGTKRSPARPGPGRGNGGTGHSLPGAQAKGLT
jgi:hypothetical protein